MTSVRIAQPVFGLGLLEAVPEQTILTTARAATGTGIQRSTELCLGCHRQTYHARAFRMEGESAKHQQQIAAAALGDMGY
jgi:CxxC motif-containing protein (DUF1111 family)